MLINPNHGFVSKVQQLMSWGHWFVFFNIFLCAVISLLYVFAEPLPTTLLGTAYLLTNWIGHTAFLTFIVFLFTIFPATLLFPYLRHVRGLGAVLTTIAFLILCVDIFTYQKLGYHLGPNSYIQAIELLKHNLKVHPLRFVAVLGVLTSTILVVQITLSNLVWKRIGQLRQVSWGKYATAFYLICFISSHSLHIWADAKNLYDVTKQDNMFPLSYPSTAKTLLTKNGLLTNGSKGLINHDTFETEHQLQNLSLNPAQQCNKDSMKPVLIDVYIADNDTAINDVEFKLDALGYQLFDKYYGPSNLDDHAFNLVYGLPANYNYHLEKNAPALTSMKLLSVTNETDLLANLTVTRNSNSPAQMHLKAWDKTTQNPIQSLNDVDQFLLVLFPSDNIISRHVLGIKSDTRYRIRNKITQPYDVPHTVLGRWLGCSELANKIMLGIDLFKRNKNIVSANFTEQTLVVMQKDKISLVYSNGEINTHSASGFKLLDYNVNYPTLVDGVNQIKRFALPTSQND
ncbi:DUF3413 domain-containing protein [Flocculibacter collagenilyticus]|uniref:DUF3413 domain-containing protein n=1 Tax=Flocculibacter collagenilyticus TaxID=2744479 RepID=UPI0018F4E831|nr:DUF3413 domain-containing protein [Flocculibacter collagenilyticus]